MKQKDIIMLAAVAAGGYLLYSWAKSSGYWDQWFGGVSPQIPQQPQQPQLPEGTVCPVPSVFRNGQCVTITNPDPTQPSQPSAPTNAELKTQLINAAKDNAYYIQGGGKMTAHQWNFYRNILRPPDLSAAAFSAAFPAPSDIELITVEQFLSKLQTAGLGAIVPTQSYSSMSMSFGGGAFGNAFGGEKRGFA